MARSLLQLVQQAQQELGLFPIATTVASAQDDTTLQMLACINRVGDDVRDSKEDGWTALQTEFVVNVVAPIITTGDVTVSSTTISNIATSVLAVDTTYVVQGTNVPQGARVASVTNASTLVMSEEASATATGVSLTISKDTYPVPSDFEAFVNRTQWDRSRRWELRGPESPQEDQWIRSGIVATGPRRRWRQIGRVPNVFRIWPPPSSSDAPATLVSEYRSSYWATASDGVTPKAYFTADADTCIFPDDVMIAGVKYYFFRAKGFDTSALEDDFNRFRDRAMARDGGRGTLSMSRRRWPIFISPSNIPDTGFGNP